MEKWILFFKIIAFIIGALSTVIGLLIVYIGWGYEGSLRQTVDNMKGYNRVFRPIPYLVVSLICWAFIIVFW